MEPITHDLLADAIRGDLSEPGVKFGAPWQAHAFALVVRMHQIKQFSWDQWVTVFSRNVALSPARAGESANDAYYRQWLSALEEIVVQAGIVPAEAIAQRAELWRQAYINTPHGQAVDLLHASCPPVHTHVVPPRGQPVAVSLSVSRT
jgi:nitrile hydratase accessory protein